MEKHGSIAAKLKAALCAMCYAFIKGVTMLMLSHGFFFSPSGAAVCAQHMESAAPRCVAQACQSNVLLYT